MTRRRATSFLISLAVVAAGGAVSALGAYLTSHPAGSPMLTAALILAVREVSKYLDRLDPTRGSSVLSAYASSSLGGFCPPAAVSTAPPTPPAPVSLAPAPAVAGEPFTPPPPPDPPAVAG